MKDGGPIRQDILLQWCTFLTNLQIIKIRRPKCYGVNVGFWDLGRPGPLGSLYEVYVRVISSAS